jgi:hypothetical protein
MPFGALCLIAALTASSGSFAWNPIAAWPQWLQIAIGVVIGGLGLWLAVKLLRVALWLLLIVLVVSAVAFLLHETGLLPISHR